MFDAISVELIATKRGGTTDRDACRDAVRLAVAEDRTVRLRAEGLRDRVVNPKRFYDLVAMEGYPAVD